MKYTESHQWIEVDQNIATIGITEHAERELGDIVYIELPRIGYSVRAGDAAVVLESTKAAIDIYTPITGEIAAVNTAMRSQPEKFNQSTEKERWLFKIKMRDMAELDTFMDFEAYQSFKN